MVGETLAANFPVTNQSGCEATVPFPCGTTSTNPSVASWAFVTKFDPTGSRALFSSYLGGANFTQLGGGTRAYAVTVDAAGNVYLAGETGSPAYPTTSNAFQPIRSRVRNSTWPGPCAPGSLVDSILPDAFVTKLSPTGAMVYSTYLGGTEYDIAYGIAVNAASEMFVTGTTQSRKSYSFNFTGCSFDQGLYRNIGFPVTADALVGELADEAGINKGFLTKLAANGTLAYSTYIGIARAEGTITGTSPAITASSVAVDNAGAVYLAGSTRDHVFGGGCRNCPADGAKYYDAFAMKFTPGAGPAAYIRVFGGTGNDYGQGMALDNGGNAYMGGTSEPNPINLADSFFPTTVGAAQVTRVRNAIDLYNNCGFLTKLGPTGTTTYSTLLCGGTGQNADVQAVAVHAASGTALVTGNAGGNMALVNPVSMGNPGGDSPYMARFNAAGSAVLFSSFLGGINGTNDNNATGRAIAVDSDLAAYVAGESSGTTLSALSGFQTVNNGQGDAFLVKMNTVQAAPTAMTANSLPMASYVNTALGLPLQVSVRDGTGQPSPGINVTFTAPAGNFTGFGLKITVATSALGIATAPEYISSGTAGAYTIVASALNLPNVNFNHYNLPIGAGIGAQAGSGQATPVNTAFGTALQALVRTTTLVPIAGVPVTFSAPGAGASGSYGGAVSVLTNASGIATAPTFTANGIVGTYNAAAAITGVSTASTNFSLTNQPPNGIPGVGTVSPAFSSGAQQTMTFTFTDTNGFADLNIINVLVASALDGRNACYVAYVRPQNILYLVTDNGADLLGPITLGATGTVSNTQCTINAAGSSATGSGNSLSMTLNMTFSAAFGGRKLIYSAARDAIAANSGWRSVGTKSVPPLPATPLSVGDAVQPQVTTATQAATFTFTSAAGVADLGILNVLINSALDGRNACYIAYARAANIIFLVDDPGTGLAPAVTPGVAGTASNSQCTINGTGTTVSSSGNTVTVTVNYTMKAAFSGNKTVWGASRNNGDTATSGWQAISSWLVP